MSFSDEDRKNIARVIAEHVPDWVLVRIIQRGSVIVDYDDIVKQFAGPVEGRYAYVVGVVVDRYDAAELLQTLLGKLVERMRENVPFLREISRARSNDPSAGYQAMRAARDSYISAKRLATFSQEGWPRVCCIAGEYSIEGESFPTSGTGFLVSPDLVLTARHVFGPAANISQAELSTNFVAYFDHREDNVIAAFRRPPPNSRVVKLAPAPDWLAEYSPALPRDGLFTPTAADYPMLRKNLDFALVKLAEPVGLEPVDPAGGPLRKWFDLPDPVQPVGLKADSRIVLPQHPAGIGLQVDFGRVMELCGSKTRIIYDPESAPGSSGAPCFNKDFVLVGIHNAKVMPDGVEVGNQAIAFEAIDGLVRGKIKASIEGHVPTAPQTSGAGGTAGSVPPPPGGATRLWNIAPPGQQVKVIIGRSVLLDWIVGSTVPSSERSARIYAATAPVKGSGKTFSVEILQRALPTRPGYRLVPLGVDRQLLPTNLADLVKVIGAQLGVPAPLLDNLPARPDATLPTSSTDGDKLRRWASVVVPEWFVGVLDSSRTNAVDLRAQAEALVAQFKAYNATAPADKQVSIPKELEEQAAANSQTGTQERWETAWIAIDSLPESSMAPEVSDFIAAMCGVGKDEAALPDVLLRLRWLFLGYRPDFLPLGDATLETLDPTNIKAEDIQVLADSIVAAGREAEPGGMPKFVNAMRAIVDAVSGQTDTANVMTILQRFAFGFLPTLLTKAN